MADERFSVFGPSVAVQLAKSQQDNRGLVPSLLGNPPDPPVTENGGNALPTPGESSGESSKGKAGKRVTVNERMRLKLQESPEAASWSVREWVEYLKSAGHPKCSVSTVHATKLWDALHAAHCLAKVEKLEQQEHKRSLDKRGVDKRKQGRNLD